MSECTGKGKYIFLETALLIFINISLLTNCIQFLEIFYLLTAYSFMMIVQLKMIARRVILAPGSLWLFLCRVISL
jgi:Na+-transporting NADH:ubiquinone oxidoreductase subunit NqrD